MHVVGAACMCMALDERTILQVLMLIPIIIILGFNTDYCAEAVMNGINCQLEQRCILYSYQCDGTPDCGVHSSASDETNCHRQYHR